MEVKKLLQLAERHGDGTSNWIQVPTAFPLIVIDVRSRFKPYIKVITKIRGQEIVVKEGKFSSLVFPLKAFGQEVKISYKCPRRSLFGAYVILDFLK